MEMYVTDRCRFFDSSLNKWVRGEIYSIDIQPLSQDRSEPVITVATANLGDFVILGTESNLHRCDFRVTFSDFPRAKG